MKQEHESAQHDDYGNEEIARRRIRCCDLLTARNVIRTGLPIGTVGDGVLERRCPGRRDVLETAKEIFCSWSSRWRFVPTLYHQPPQSVRKAQRPGANRLSRAFPFPYSDQHRISREVVEGSVASQYLTASEWRDTVRIASSLPHR